ncbi:MAG: alkaline phosphatase family protein [Candidatus Abyssubacteria bacterium]
MKNHTHNNRVAVIGLDGGTLDIIKPWAEAGILPNFRAILQKAVHGPLQTIFPPVTPPAWASFATGKTPEFHGVFDFFDHSSPGRRTEVISSRHIRSETLWHILSRHGKRVCVMNVPVTYPPSPVNGCMITGMLTPSTQSEFTYPATLYNELRKELGEYIISVTWMQYKESEAEKFIEDLARCTRIRARYATHLLEREPWDFFMMVFSGVDCIQHALWDIIASPESELRGERAKWVRRRAVEYYQELDALIGDMVSRLGDDVHLYFMSDHGFGPLNAKFHINKWLEKIGLMSLDKKKEYYLQAKWQVLRTLTRLDRAGVRKMIFRKKAARKQVFRDMTTGCILWERTLAYSAFRTEQGIYINLKGREPSGTVSPGTEYEELRGRIIRELKAMSAPGQPDRPLVTRISRREEVFDGPYAHFAPDILFAFDGGGIIADDILASPMFERSTWFSGTGTHRLEGLFIARGAGIRENAEIQGARIQDVAPTILYSLGLPVPDDMNGRVLNDAFTEEFRGRRSVEYEARSNIGERADESAYTEEEERLVKERLRNLGYIE